MTSAYGRFIQQVRLDQDVDDSRYPFSLPAVRQLARSGALTLPRGVTFLVGENGAGKSTLIESIAVAAGFNPEGGSRNFRFATRATESELGEHLILTWGIRKPRTDFFLRAESYYNVASEIERLDGAGGRPLLPAYGGVSPHERSHGESFLDLVTHRFGPAGLYLLDEPEAALSVQSRLALLARMHDLVAQGSQFLIATHSPILLALPGATIMEISDEGGLEQVDFDQALPVRLTRQFLGAPDRFLRNLLGAEENDGTQGGWL
ncbi:AAA family ATPase [Streptomyces sp. NPDC048304]|uniref:AAA family ATPase n=1 Tax=Streptomyces sp. NPDC048304 TaxID=3154820 RepID=UPI0033D3E9A3